ncbi:DUF3604 domain-containing protein [Vibrio sp. M60_M31a]
MAEIFMAKYSSPLIAFFIFALTGCNDSQVNTEVNNGESVSAVAPQSDRNIKINPMKDVYWGDTHNHTGNSFDVFLFWNA